jgi:hypothetical protein
MGAVMGIYSENKTWFLMGFSLLFLDEDNWRVIGAVGTGNVNFQFYLDFPVNSWIPYNTKADFFFTQIQRRIYERLYLGITYIYSKMETSTNLIPGTYDANLNGVGMNLFLDQRKNIFYPRGGFQSKIRYMSFPEWLSNDFVSQKVEIEHNHYFPVRKDQDVIAGRIFAGLGIGDLSFNQQFIVGQKDLRGYTQGAFRGNYLLAVQGEYRWNLICRFSLVGFAGLATVFAGVGLVDMGIAAAGRRH